MPPPDKATFARVCRMYKTSTEAARVLGINTRTFNIWCAKYGITTPWQKQKAAWDKAKGRIK